VRFTNGVLPSAGLIAAVPTFGANPPVPAGLSLLARGVARNTLNPQLCVSPERLCSPHHLSAMLGRLVEARCHGPAADARLYAACWNTVVAQKDLSCSGV